jgi:nicotinate phosphoribosyltransferase
MDQKSALTAEAAQALDRLADISDCAGETAALTDKYFSLTRRIALAHGDSTVVYALFMRRRVIAALEPAIRLLKRLVPEAEVVRFFEEGELIPSERKIMEIKGPFSRLAEAETLILQKVGLPCVCANNAFEMCLALPHARFIDMHARHAAGAEMNILAAYGAAVGSAAAKRRSPGVKGFIGSSQDLTAPFFGADKGLGTMPHALIGLLDGDVVEATRLLVETAPELRNIVALVDYAGREITDGLRVARWFYEEAKLQESGRTFGVRLDTHGGRFAEGLDYEKSVEIVGEWLGVEGEYNIVEQVLGGRAFLLDPDNILVDRVRRILFGKGVSLASIIHMRRAFDAAGFESARIVVSSGFNTQKCQILGAARAPIDTIGTGSFLPATLSETYATADIISYDGTHRVKLGREFLIDGSGEGEQRVLEETASFR